MTPTLATTLALIAIGLFGLLFGVLLALLGGLAYSLHLASRNNLASITHWRQEIGRVVADTAQTSDRLRLDILAALSRLDADRLHEASQAIQRGASSLTTQTQALGKMLYASAATTQAGLQSMFDPLGNPVMPGATREAFSLDEEADDDARMLADRNRWAADQSGQQFSGSRTGPPPTGLTYVDELTDPAHARSAAIPDPFAGLTHEERQAALDKFWADRRAGVGGGKSASQVLAEAAEDTGRTSQPSTLPDLGDAGQPDAAHPDPFVQIKSEMED